MSEFVLGSPIPVGLVLRDEQTDIDGVSCQP